MDNKFYVLSLRDIKKSPAFCCAVEFEDVIIESLGAELIKPGHIVEKSTYPRTLFVVGISIYDIDQAIRSIKQDEFDQICAYIFDAFALPAEFKRPNWHKAISSHHRTIRKITHLFVPFRQSVAEFERLYQIPVSYIPLGVDAVKHGGYDENKIIDVNGYGRQPATLESLLSERFNVRGSNRIYHHTNHAHTPIIHDVYTHRRLFWQQLRRSKIALAFDPLHTNYKNGKFTFSFIGQRWFESAAAGCVIVGKRPTCNEFDELFGWEHSTIELPDSVSDMADTINFLLNEWDLETIGRRNNAECLSRHDWRFRIDDMLKIIEANL
jgi:Glycosyl transferases group 1